MCVDSLVYTQHAHRVAISGREGPAEMKHEQRRISDAAFQQLHAFASFH